MPAPQTVRVKLSSEAAGAVALTPVVVRDLALRELLEEIAAVCGKDLPRIAGILRQGTLVSGATRFRWQTLEVPHADLVPALDLLPDPKPTRGFTAGLCRQAVFVGPGVSIALDRSAGQSRRFFRRASFWDSLVQVFSAAAYVTYHYRERADLYRVPLSLEHRAHIRAALPLLKNRTLARQLEASPFESLHLFVPR